MGQEEIRRTLLRLSHQILERNKEPKNLGIVGIQRRGVHLAARMSQIIEKSTGQRIPSGRVDITLYRDDLQRIAYQPIVRSTEISFSIDNMRLVLVDDVLYTGRTVRAAIDALLDIGRPRNIQLAVLVDRGHRELPIRADYVGRNIPTSLGQMVEVRVTELDGKDEVLILDKK